jgi:hypothetical protein
MTPLERLLWDVYVTLNRNYHQSTWIVATKYDFRKNRPMRLWTGERTIVNVSRRSYDP